MESAHLELPWDEIGRGGDDVPWRALEQFAEAVAAREDVLEDLLRLYEESYPYIETDQGFACLYAAGIVAMAGPRLSDAARDRAADFLVRAVMQAVQDEIDVLEHALLSAAGSLGSKAVLPAALKHMPPDFRSARPLWELGMLAADTDDIVLRQRVLDLATEALVQAESGQTELEEVGAASWVLAALGDPSSRPLLERLDERGTSLDVQEALGVLREQGASNAFDKPWEEPVRAWLEKDWEDLPYWQGEREAEEEEEAVEQDQADLAERFAASDAVAALPEDLREDAERTAFHVLDYAWRYEGTPPEALTEQTLRAVLLEWLPGKMSVEQTFFEHLAPLTQAFLRWLQTEGILRIGERLGRIVAGWHDQIVHLAADPRNWHMAKSVVMEAVRQGVDPTNEEEMGRFVAEYNRRFARPHEPLPTLPVPPEELPLPPEPIVREGPKIGRNDPCPCGSGRKYKKCCGK